MMEIYKRNQLHNFRYYFVISWKYWWKAPSEFLVFRSKFQLETSKNWRRTFNRYIAMLCEIRWRFIVFFIC